MRLRVHHLLCSALYAGKGYSEEFCENMDKAVAQYAADYFDTAE